MISKQRYRDCYLNTCVRFYKDPEITLTNCKESKDFKEKAIEWLRNPFFNGFDLRMEDSRRELIVELMK